MDTKIDAQLGEDSPLRGRIPIGPLWASTGTRNPNYSDTVYVAELITARPQVASETKPPTIAP